jgi:flagellar M-ring protein FliF
MRGRESAGQPTTTGEHAWIQVVSPVATLTRFLESLKALGAMRLLGLLGVAVAILAIVGFVALRGNGQPMALLYGDMELRDSAQVAAALDKIHVPYEIRDNGAQILVPSDQVDHLRLTLARDNLPGGGSVGYEVFDRGDSLTSNQFQQQINQLRALEGELGRTIRSIRGVRNARVHLVLARREPFARQQQEAQASIVLSMAGSQRMSDDEVQAIVNLVSSAVPGLKTQNISMIDNRGQLLARSGRPSGQDATASSNDEMRRAMEQRLNRAVEDMLSSTLGPGHVRAETSVEMNFERINETQEKFDPEGQVPRSQQTVTDSSKTSDPPAGVSVQNNLPNPDGQSSATGGSGSNRQEENTIFEVGKTTRVLVHDSPSIKRISMAVLVDGVTTRSAEGQPAWHELNQADLDRITMLARSAVGFDEKRGDHVEVVNMRFNTPEELADPAPVAYPWLQFGKADMIWLITIAIVALVALFALGFVVRPLALKLATRLPVTLPALAAPGDGPGGLSAGVSGAIAIGASAQHRNPLQVGSPSTETPEQDTMLNLSNVQGGVRASSIRELGDLVQTHPEAAVTVIRGWLSEAAT